MVQGSSNGFWQCGCQLYLEALRCEEHDRIAPLLEALKAATLSRDRQRLQEHIRLIQEEYGWKRESASERLY